MMAVFFLATVAVVQAAASTRMVAKSKSRRFIVLLQFPKLEVKRWSWNNGGAAGLGVD